MKKVFIVVGSLVASATVFGMGIGNYSEGNFGNNGQKRSRSSSPIIGDRGEDEQAKRPRISDSEGSSSSGVDSSKLGWLYDGAESFLRKLVLEREDGDEILHFLEDGKSFLEFITYLIEDKKININETCNNEGSTLLHLASRDGDLDSVKYLIEHNAEVDRTDKIGRAPLVFACQSNEESVVRYLVEHGADVNKENKYNEISLLCSCELGNESIVKYLIEQGANANKERVSGETPLFSACKSGNKSLVKYLVEENNADVNKSDTEGNTPLMCACEFGHEQVVKYLIARGADVDAENAEGLTPLFIARDIAESDSIVEYLLKSGDTKAVPKIEPGLALDNIIKYLEEDESNAERQVENQIQNRSNEESVDLFL